MNTNTLSFIWVFLLLACSKPASLSNTKNMEDTTSYTALLDTLPEEKATPIYTDLEKRFLEQGFVDVQEVLPHAQLRIEYATEQNAFSQRLYDSINHIFLHPSAIKKLQVADSLLQEWNPNYVFLLFDGLRPRSVQHKMWKVVKGTNKQRYVASPYAGSIHNYGCAIDLTVIDTLNGELDMGTPFDSFELRAQYRHNQHFKNTGELSAEAVENRIKLRQIMRSAGFRAIDSEWWHFNAFSNKETRARFKIVE